MGFVPVLPEAAWLDAALALRAHKKACPICGDRFRPRGLAGAQLCPKGTGLQRELHRISADLGR